MNSNHDPSKTEDTDKLRRSIIADLYQAGGWPQGRLSMEVLYLLPKEFTDAYVHLFHSALKEQAPVVSVGKGADELGKAAGGVVKRTGSRLQAQGGGKKYKDHWMISSEKALARKQRVDAKLRELAALMESRPGSHRNERAGQCGTCKKFLQSGWRFCPGCGAGIEVTRSVDGSNRRMI